MRRGFRYQVIISLKIISLIIFNSLFLIPSVKASTPLLITSGRNAPFVTQQQNGFYDLIVANMFKRVGVSARIISLPSERSLKNADNGINDGNVARIKGLEKEYPNLVRVPEKIIDFEFVVFTKNKTLDIKHVKDLKPFNVSYINGWKYFEKKVQHYSSLNKVKNTEQLFYLLKKDRVDISLYDRWSGVWWIKNNPGDIGYLLPPLASVELYLYLNKKHKELVPKLAQALANMKKDGTYQSIYNKTLRNILKK